MLLRRSVSLWIAFGCVAALVVAGSEAAAVACVDAPAGLLARWPGDGDTVDVAHGRNGSLGGDAAFSTGQVGEAFALDGSGDTVAIPDDPDWTLRRGDFTIDLWTKLTATPGSAAFMAHSQGGGLNPKWLFWLNGGYLTLDVDDPSQAIEVVRSPWSPTMDQWYHLAVTRSGNRFRLYIDGVQVASASNTFDIPDPAAALTIGSAESDFWVNGLIDEVELYRRALSGDEISTIHDQGAAVRCDPLEATLQLAAEPSAILGGEVVKLTGSLALEGGGSVADRPVEIWRSVDGGSPVLIATRITGPGGGFSFKDQPPVGRVSYRASYPGDVGVTAANARASAKVTQETSKLTLSVSASKVTFGQRIRVQAHLEGGSTNRVVAIYGEAAGGSKRLLAKAEVGASGNLVAQTVPAATTTYTAVYAGDPGWTPDTAGPTTVHVRGRWSINVIGGYATKNGVRLYHYSEKCGPTDSTGCPAAVFRLSPSHAGERVTFEGKFCGDGSCHTSTSTYRLNDASKLRIFIYYGDRAAIGWRLDFRIRFPGDEDHLPATSAWVKTKVTA